MAIAARTARALATGLAALVAMLALWAASFACSASAAKYTATKPMATSTSTSGTFVRAYSNVVNKTQFSLTPEDVQQTADGGYIALATTQSSSRTHAGVSWLLKLSASGTAQWQRELGCLDTPPGDYADGASIAQAADGAYVVGGGTIGCGSGTTCPSSSGIACAMVEKVVSSGRVVWAKVYAAGGSASAIDKIRPTNDGGYLAVGTATDTNQNTGGLILKLDGQGNVQWQRQLGPAGSAQVLLNDVRQASDGGYVATGQFYTPSANAPQQSVLVVKLDSSGNVLWRHGFNSFDSAGSPTASENARSIIQASDGGYVIAGSWNNAPTPNQCCAGALLLKLDASGSIQWQNAYSGGLYCFFNGFSETCTNLGAVAYSVHQTERGYVLAGDENLKLSDGAPIVPWLSKVDSSGNLLWQHLYYQANKSTGRPISEYFASSTPSSSAGSFSLGFTEGASNGRGELFGVKTDSAGLAGSPCGDVHLATTLNPINPGLTAIATLLPVRTTPSPTGSSPTVTVATSLNTQPDC